MYRMMTDVRRHSRLVRPSVLPDHSAQLEDNSLPQAARQHQLAGLGTQSLFPGTLVGIDGAIPPGSTIAGNLPADRRGRTPQNVRDRPDRLICYKTSRYLLSLSQRQR